MSENKRWRLSRRNFLIGFGVTTATLAVGIKLGTPAARLQIARVVEASNGASPMGALPEQPDAWFEITADNQVRFFVPKIEMGQGVHTSLGQIAADELEVAWPDLEIVQANTDRPFAGISGTGNSNSVSSLYLPIREMAATLRGMLITEAARRLAVDPAQLAARDTAVTVIDDPNTQLTYGELIENAAAWEVPETQTPLKSSSDFHIVGKPVPRVDFPAKLMGQAIYGYDMRLPDMLYGVAAHAPTLEGRLTQASPGTAPEKEGVVKIVIDDEFAGVVAESRQQAYTGLNNLELEWNSGKLWQQAEIDELVTVGNGTRVVVQREGERVDSYLNDNEPDVLRAEYRTPIAAHAHLEAQAALVDVQPDRVRAWVSTQYPSLVRDELADILGREPETVTVEPTFLGGGFGRKLNTEAAAEAARLSAAAGRPVHVGWNRTEDLRYGFFRPPTHHVLRGKLGDDGRLLALRHEVASGDVLFAQFPGPVGDLIGADIGAYRGALIQYGIPHRETVSYRTKLPIRTGPWRGLGLLANTFAVESFMDDAARAAGTDPLEFRLQQLPDSERGRRYRTVLEAAAEAANWGGTLLPGHAQGIAVSIDVNTVVAEVAEVSLTADNELRVHNVTAAVDPGLIINPDGVRAQTEGSIMMGLSSTFFEEITIKNGMVEASNFDRYPLLTMKEAPFIDVVLLQSSDTPYGVGEPPIGPVAAAVGNAYFALTSKRFTQLPIATNPL